MKDKLLKYIPAILGILIISSMLYSNKGIPSSLTISEKNTLENTINQILKEDSNLKLLENKNIDNKFTYLEFSNDNKIYSYFFDDNSYELKDFTYYLKENSTENFYKKIEELIYLKYPNFIADIVLKNKETWVYKIDVSELIIYFDSSLANPEVNEELYLRVNYNEIKEYLDFTLLLVPDYQNEDGYNYDPNKKTVALTFDDGPNGAKTRKIVELLKQNKAHATFFMIGNRMQFYASTINEVLNNGNEIGSHSYDHTNMSKTKLNKLIDNEAKTSEIYHNITGESLIYTRPPYGAINKTVKNSLNTIFITWSLDTEDWAHRDKDYIVNNVKENISDGDIILMHDLYDSTVDAVSELLPLLYSEGYQVVSVSELAKLKDVTLENNNIYRNIK